MRLTRMLLIVWASLAEGGVNVEFDADSNATCINPSGRSLHGEESTSCDGYDIVFTLGPDRHMNVVSCRADENLTFELSGGDTSDFTTDERAFFDDVANSIELLSGADLEVPDSLEAQTLRAAEILAEWPTNLPVNYALNSISEANHHQRELVLLRDEDVPGNPPNLFQHDGSFTPHNSSLCNDLGLWLKDRNNGTAARLGVDPPCQEENGTGKGMYVWNSSSWQCVDSPLPSTDWAYGNCFGRCGGGCGSSKQFTLDCADYDFCVHLQVGAEENGCHDEFLRTMDDTMWSSSCSAFSRAPPPEQDECLTPEDGGGNDQQPVPSPAPLTPDSSNSSFPEGNYPEANYTRVPGDHPCATEYYRSSLINGNDFKIDHDMAIEICCDKDTGEIFPPEGGRRSHKDSKVPDTFLSAENKPVTRSINLKKLRVDWSGAAILRTFNGPVLKSGKAGILKLEEKTPLHFLLTKSPETTEAKAAGKLHVGNIGFDSVFRVWLFWSYGRSVEVQCVQGTSGEWKVKFLPEKPKPVVKELKIHPDVKKRMKGLKDDYTRKKSVHDIYD